MMWDARRGNAVPMAAMVGALLCVTLGVAASAEDSATGDRPVSDKVAGAKIDHENRFASVTAFVKLLGDAKDVRLYVGLPRAEVGQSEGENDKRTNVVAHKGFKFFDNPHAVSGDRLRTLHKALARADTFVPFGGPKFCGGFHPDYLLEWQCESKTYQALFCFGCHEIRWFEAEKYEVWCDMTEAGAKSLKEALYRLAEGPAGE